MAKTKTSKKQNFSFETMKTTKVKSNGLKEHDPKKLLRSSKNVFDALIQTLQDGDPDAFKEILSAHLSVVNKDDFTKKAQISRRTLFRMLSPEGNPTLDNLARVFRALKVA